MKFEDTTTILDVNKLSQQLQIQRSACFIVLTGGQAGRMYKLDGLEITIGRAAEAIIRIEDDGVSRRHARIGRTEAGEVTIKDLGSTNGTYCNGAKIAVHTLQDGDKIQIGTTTILKFSYQDSVEEDFQRRQYESATRDALTGCYNKKYLLERLPSEMAFAQRHNKPLALALYDVDYFKRINDSYGHLAGDALLQGLSTRVTDAIRTDDVLARYGGEEFALIMRETLADAAFAAAERIRKAVASEPFRFQEHEIGVTISVGVAVSVEGEPSTADELIKLADRLLYRAKERGRNRSEM